VLDRGDDPVKSSTKYDRRPKRPWRRPNVLSQ